MSLSEVSNVVLIGVGATVLLDLWLAVLGRLGVPTLSLALIGRWVGHAARGQVFQPSIAKAAPIRGERVLGWITHYAIGIVFAGLLVAVTGPAWLRSPSLMPAVIAGMLTVAAPLFVMQPAMGAGFAASRTPTPVRNCMRSLISHTVFGVGLYLSSVLVEWMRAPLGLR
jgi:hypothetical protein